MFKKISLLTLACILSGPMLSTPASARRSNGSAFEVKDAKRVLKKYLKHWENGRVKKMEFMLHNSFVSSAGEKKFTFVKRLKREARNMAGRRIRHKWRGAKFNGNNLQIKYFLNYTEQFKNYKHSKYFHSCQNVTLNLVRYKDGKLYLTREWASKAKCPS